MKYLVYQPGREHPIDILADEMRWESYSGRTVVKFFARNDMVGIANGDYVVVEESAVR